MHLMILQQQRIQTVPLSRYVWFYFCREAEIKSRSLDIIWELPILSLLITVILLMLRY